MTEADASKILIDTDPGIDDAMAIFYALASPELEVVGLTTVFGNAHTSVCTTNALKLLEIAERVRHPCRQGGRRPAGDAVPRPGAVRSWSRRSRRCLPVAARCPSARRSMPRISSFARRSNAPGEITLVALGPLTNVAIAMLIEPTLATQLAGIVLMGGNAFCGGNASPAAEANILNDPEAADLVFGADCPIVMAGLDVTEQTLMTSADMAQFSSFGNARAQHLSAIIPFYENFYRERNGIDGIFVHDSSTISYLLAPQLFTWVEQPVRVDCGHSFCSGKTQTARHESDHESEWSPTSSSAHPHRSRQPRCR